MRIITLEEHLRDPAIAEAARPALERLAPYQAAMSGSGQPPPLGDDPAARLAAMDRHGIDMQVLSYSDQLQYAPAAQAPALARAANDRLAGWASQHPQRFAGFCTLPWQDPQAAVQELERAAQLGLKGCMLIGRPGERALLDDPAYEPVLARLEGLRLPLYVHPGPPLTQVQQPYYGGLHSGEQADAVSARLSLFGWGWHHEAGIQVLRLILSGTLDRHPGLQLISGHWGEMVPFFLQRLDDTLPPEVTGLTRSVSQTYRDQVWVTPSGMLTLPHFHFVREVLGVDRLLYSLDYPYLGLDGGRPWLEALSLSEAEGNALAHGNAGRLLHLG